jgi:hypothetical protein
MESPLQCFGSKRTEAADRSEAHWEKQKPPKEHKDLFGGSISVPSGNLVS